MIDDTFPAHGGRSMDAPPPLPVLKYGFYTGVAMVVEMAVALIVINRVSALEPYALERNAFFMGCFFVLMLVPVCRFLRAPVQMFSAAMTAWAIFVAGYYLAGFYFERLFEALHRGPLLVLVEGAVLYGIAAVGSWVAEMLVHACRHSILPGRRAARAAARHAR
jgi:hypothetical protein